MRAALPAEVLAILNIQSSPGSLASAGAALDATFSQVEEWLETSLALTERIDYFHIPNRANNPTLRLTNSMLTETDPLVLKHSLYYKTNGDIVPADSYVVDRANGTVQLLGVGYSNCTFSVQYVSGFDTKAADAATLDEVPEAIRACHASAAAGYLQLNPANVSKDKARTLGPLAVNGYYIAAKQGALRMQRPRGLVLLPDSTVLVV